MQAGVQLSIPDYETGCRSLDIGDESGTDEGLNQMKNMDSRREGFVRV